MKKVIKIKESDIRNIVKKVINEQTEIDEYGVKGMWKKEWNEGDQMLAMYNALYGIEDLGITKEEAAHDIIGSSLGSFLKQTSNFNYLSGKGGLDRPHTLQSPVYDKYKKYPHREFKKLCLDIIEKRLSNPEESSVKMKLGKSIGNKRDEASIERRKNLRDQGVNPNHATMISQKPKFDPVDDEPEVQQSPRKNTPKDEVKSYLKQMYDKFVESNPELADDIQFITDYIDSELVDKEMLSEIRKLFKVTINENKTSKMKKVIKLKESDIKNIVKRIISEQGFDRFDDDAIDDEMMRNDEIDRWVSDEPVDSEGTNDSSDAVDRFRSIALILKDMGIQKDELFDMVDDLFSPRTNKMYENKTKKVIKLKSSDISKIKSVVKRVIKENFTPINGVDENEEESILAKQYVDKMIDLYKNYKDIRINILRNVVNSEYGRHSNSYVTKVWDEFNKQFPS